MNKTFSGFQKYLLLIGVIISKYLTRLETRECLIYNLHQESPRSHKSVHVVIIFFLTVRVKRNKQLGKKKKNEG